MVPPVQEDEAHRELRDAVALLAAVPGVQARAGAGEQGEEEEMTYEECEQLVSAFESATLLKEKLGDDELRLMAGTCADSIGEFIASMMAQAWKRTEECR